MTRAGTVCCVILGSFLLYCGQSAMNAVGSPDGGGFVGEAMGEAGTCCTAPAREAPTVLFDDLVSGSPVAGSSANCTFLTPVLDVSAYRTIVIHTPSCAFTAQFRNGKAGFVDGPEQTCAGAGNPLGRAMTVDASLGRELRVTLGFARTGANPDGLGSCSTRPTPVTIVGYRGP